MTTSAPKYFSLFLSRVKACAERLGADLQYVDKQNGRLVSLTREGRTCLIGAAPVKLWPFNSSLSMSVTNDKELVLRILAGVGLSVPSTRIAFTDMARYDHLKNPPPSADEVVRALSLEAPLVVKPNDGKGGEGLSIVHEQEGVTAALAYAKRFCHAVLFQEYIPGEDIRVYALDGLPTLMLTRAVPKLRGDGRLSVRDLLDRSETRREGTTASDGYRISVESLLTRHGDRVPAAGEEIAPFPVANLSQGGKPDTVAAEVSPVWDAICETIARVLRLRFFAVDARLRSAGEDPVILEVNSNPGIEMVFEASEAVGEKFLDSLVSRAIHEELPNNGIQSDARSSRR